MYIKRDISQLLNKTNSLVKILLGPRQCGKSTLLANLFLSDAINFHEITFDDLQLRELANRDPALFMEQFPPPLLLDEIQYVPNLFPEIKKIIDQLKRAKLLDKRSGKGTENLFYLTGSNQILMDKNIKESLAGRASYYYLNTLSVHEILQALPATSIKDILFKGGWPELYINSSISPVMYLNDYIRSYVEKDIVMSAGIQKLSEFHTVLRLLSARTAQEIKYTEISNNAGVSSVTVKEWAGFLERADLVYLLKPYFNNLNSRLIKTPKLYFLDVGLAARLQGWSDPTPMLHSPQAGALFETLVLSEIVKFIRNYGKDWELFFWRTKDGEEIDFILKTNNNVIHTFEAKMSINGVPQALNIPKGFAKYTANTRTPFVIITYGGKKLKLTSNCMAIPLAELHDYLLSIEDR